MGPVRRSHVNSRISGQFSAKISGRQRSYTGICSTETEGERKEIKTQWRECSDRSHTTDRLIITLTKYVSMKLCPNLCVGNHSGRLVDSKTLWAQTKPVRYPLMVARSLFLLLPPDRTSSSLALLQIW